MLKPRALLEGPQLNVHPGPANVPTPALEANRFGPRGESFRPQFAPQGNDSRERVHERGGGGVPDPPRPRPLMEMGQAVYNRWERPQQGSGEVLASSRPPTEEIFADQERFKGGEHFRHHQQPQPLQEQSNPPAEQGTEFHLPAEAVARDELASDGFKRSSRGEEWGRYGSGYNVSDSRADSKNSPSTHQFPYQGDYDQSDRSNTMTSSPSFSVSSQKSNEPTISSLRKNTVTAIPGLGGGFEDQGEDLPKPVEPSSNVLEAKESSQQVEGGEGGGGGGEKEINAGESQANHMIKSLGKIVSQLQTLKGLTSSLQLLQTFPTGAGEEAQGAETAKPKESSETELSEETKRKVAALLATESDSDGEQVTTPFIHVNL